jgi:hypothetical protein
MFRKPSLNEKMPIQFGKRLSLAARATLQMQIEDPSYTPKNPAKKLPPKQSSKC